MVKRILVATLAYITVEGVENEILEVARGLSGKFVVMTNPEVCGSTPNTKVTKLEFAFSRLHDATEELEPSLSSVVREIVGPDCEDAGDAVISLRELLDLDEYTGKDK